MTTELEKQFFDTFGIEPKYQDTCTVEEKYWDNYHRRKNEEQWDLCFECQQKLTSQYLNPNLKKYD